MSVCVCVWVCGVCVYGVCVCVCVCVWCVCVVCVCHIIMATIHTLTKLNVRDLEMPHKFCDKNNNRKTSGQVTCKKIRKCLKKFLLQNINWTDLLEDLRGLRWETTILNQRYQTFGWIRNLCGPEFISRNCKKDRDRRHNLSCLYIYVFIAKSTTASPGLWTRTIHIVHCTISTSSSSSWCSWRVRRVSCSLILKMQLVPPSLPRSSYVPSSFWFIL